MLTAEVGSMMFRLMDWAGGRGGRGGFDRGVPEDAWRWSRVALVAGELATAPVTGELYERGPFWAAVRAEATARLAAVGGTVDCFNAQAMGPYVQDKALQCAAEWLNAAYPSDGQPRCARTDRDLARLGDIAVIGVFGTIAGL